MKLFIFSVLFACSLNASEETYITAQQPRKHDASAYAEGNFIKKDASLDILKKFDIVLSGKKVLDIECGVGEISAFMAQSAKKVYGVDSHPSLLGYACEQYDSLGNISFEHSLIEDFKTQKLYDIATTFFCLHFIKNRQEAFATINKSLKIGGEFLATINTTSNPMPLDLQVLLEVIPTLKTVLPSLNNFDIQKDLGCSYPTPEELGNLFANNGFAILAYNPQYTKEFFVTREKLEDFMWSIAISRPAIEQVPQDQWESCFTLFIDHFLTKLQQNEDGLYILPIINTTVFHLCKLAEIVDEPQVSV